MAFQSLEAENKIGYPRNWFSTRDSSTRLKQEEASRENNNIRCFWLTGRVKNSARIR